MNRGIASVLAATAAAGMFALAADPPAGEPPKTETKPAAKPPEFKSNKDRYSYVVGLNIGREILKDLGRADAVNADQLLKGLSAGLAGDQAFDRQAMLKAILEYRLDVIKEDAGKFLEANKKKEGVKTTASGLQYQVLTSGSGKTPTDANTVKVHYTGTLVNGAKFDSSYDSPGGQPAEFGVTGVVAGWTEALKMMKEGDKWRVFVPPELGYKDKGKGKVPPYAVMVFEMELIEVK